MSICKLTNQTHINHGLGQKDLHPNRLHFTKPDNHELNRPFADLGLYLELGMRVGLPV